MASKSALCGIAKRAQLKKLTDAPGSGAHDLDTDEMYRIACGQWGVQPSEFWGMCPHEWWLHYDVKIGGRIKEKENTIDRLHKLLDKFK